MIPISSKRPETVDGFTSTPIGHVSGGRTEAAKDHWGNERCRIILDDTRFSPKALHGLEEFSHVLVVFYFHLEASEHTETGCRHPRGRADWPAVGIFAQRGRMRPNRIGVSIASVIKVEGLAIELLGLDAVDGTPVLDLKPVFSGYCPRGHFFEPLWAREIMENYW